MKFQGDFSEIMLYSWSMAKKKQSVIPILFLALLMGLVGGVAGRILEERYQVENVFKAPVVDVPVVQKTDVVEVIGQVAPAVVSVVGQEYDDEGQLIAKGAGSGFVVSADGFVVTNKHVVQSEKAVYKVLFDDGRSYAAQLVGKDAFDDLAILKIEAVGLPFLALGDSDLVDVGESVLSFGNALAVYDNTVTAGIISGKERNIAAFDGNVGRAENLSGLLQTDAAINKGNSGGPLVNLSGEVIGVNVAVADANGIGFAIPSNDLQPILDSVAKYGEIVRPMLGLRFVMLNAAQAENLGIDQAGALVAPGASIDEPALVPGGPAEEAGLKDHDFILAVNDVVVTVDHPLQKLIRNYEPGDLVTLKVWRAGQTFDLLVKLGKAS